MATLSESQAFLDQFDKCLPLCERGDAVTVVNALHSLNQITKAGLSQALELDPASGHDFVCSFLLELELALELYNSPSKKLGTTDGGLPKLYSYTDQELCSLSDVPSVATKGKVRKFLEALGVAPSARFESRSVKDAVSEFLAAQVKPAQKAKAEVLKERDSRSISWADVCSSGSECGSDDDDLPPLEVEEDDEEEASAPRADVDAATREREACEGFFGAEAQYTAEAVDKKQEEEEEECADDEDYESEDESVASSIFLWSAPVKHSELNLDEFSAAHNKAGAEARRSRALYPFFKTVMCKNHPNCKYGDRCNFAHGPEELRKLDETILCALPRPKSPDSDTSSVTAASDRNSESGSSTGVATNFKTRMCKNYEKNGFCKFGDKCNYAHGRDELRRGERGAQRNGLSSPRVKEECKRA